MYAVMSLVKKVGVDGMYGYMYLYRHHRLDLKMPMIIHKVDGNCAYVLVYDSIKDKMK